MLLAFDFLRGIVKIGPVKNVENLIYLRCKLRHIDIFEAIICAIRVQIFILVSLLCEFVTV